MWTRKTFLQHNALLWNSSSQKFTEERGCNPCELGMVTVFSPPQHCSRPSTSYTIQIFSHSALLPHSLNTRRKTDRGEECRREAPALLFSLLCRNIMLHLGIDLVRAWSVLTPLHNLRMLGYNPSSQFYMHPLSEWYYMLLQFGK